MSNGAKPSDDAAVDQRLNLRHMRERTYLPDDQAPYHGVSHPDRVWAKAQLLVDRCATLGIEVDGDALRNAVELHDALSHIPPHSLGENSAERVAANITYRFLLDCGYSEATALTISNIVMATNPDVRPTTTEEMIMRAADMWNVGSSYQDFKEGSLALHREAEIAKRAEIPFSQWLRGAYLYLDRFMWPMLELTPAARDAEGRSVFHTNAVRNMATLWRETFEDSLEVKAEFFPSGQITPDIKGPRSFYIAIHPDEDARREAVAPLHSGALAVNGAAVVVPGDRGSFSIPDGLCTHVRCHDASRESFNEALRITREGGLIILDFPQDVDPSILALAEAFPHAVSDETSGRTLAVIKRVVV